MAAHDANGKSKSLNKPSRDLDLFDQIQDEFDDLLSGDELPQLENLHAAEENTLTDPVLQDTTEFLSTIDMCAFDMSSDKPTDIHAAAQGADASDTNVTEMPTEQAVIETMANETSAGGSEKVLPGDDDNSDAGVPESGEPESTPLENEASRDETDAGDLPAAKAEPEAEAKPEQDIAEPAMAAVAVAGDNAIAEEAASTASIAPIEDNLAHDQETNDFSRLDKELESTSSETVADLELTNKIFLQESDLSDVSPADEEVNSSPELDQHPADLDGVNPFADDMDDMVPGEKAPVHPDMSEDNITQRRGGGRLMMLAGIIVVMVAGGIYWFTGGTQEPAKQLASGQKQSDSKTGDKQPGLSDTSSVNPATPQQAREKIPTETAALKQHHAEQAAAAQQAKTEKEAIQRAAVEKAKAEQLAAKQAAEKRAAAEKKAVRKIAVIEPSTQILEQPLDSQATAAVADEPGEWIIELASVNSDKSARQHMARIRAMGVESKTVQVNNKGRIFHSIRIAGFASKAEAMKRRDVLMKLLGVHGAKVEKL